MSGFLMTEDALSQALCGGIIRPDFQPVYRVPDGIPVGFEVLARRSLPDGCTVPPDIFIAQAAHSRLETAIVRMLMESAMPTACRLARTLRQPLMVGFNVGPASVSDPAFEGGCAAFVAPCRGTDVSLVLEVTEREPLMPEHTAALGRLRAAGAAIVLDNYGTGYATTDVLSWLRPDIVKLDRSLTVLAGAGDSHGWLDEALNAACCAGATILAGGVEKFREYGWLYSRGIRLFQGELFGRPVSPEVLEGGYSEFILSRDSGRMKCADAAIKYLGNCMVGK